MGEKNFVITIAREKGSGGNRIAKVLSDDLQIPYYDRDLLRRASDVSGINETLFGRADERIGFKEMMSAAQSVYTGEVLPPDSNDYVSTKNLFAFQAKVIKEMAKTESCIIIGRCADFLLSDYPNVFRVFLHASVEFRKARVKADNETFSEREVMKRLKDCDKRRADYYKYYTGDDWFDARHFDVSIDTSVLGVDETAKYIEKLLPLFTNIR